MGDRTENLMDLDLNLGPASPGSPVMGLETGPSTGEATNLDEFIEEPLHRTIREALRQRTRQRWRWRNLHMPVEARSLRLVLNSDGSGSGPGAEREGEGEGVGGRLHAGEGSVAAEERNNNEVAKTCENHVTLMENGLVDEKEDVEKNRIEEGSFFDCNICLDLARDPIVTCCGHLFCWSCMYRWLHIHSDAKECPVCKGEVSIKTVTPIYGRGNHPREAEEDSDIKIPVRPSARRVDSLRQTIHRTASNFPLEEMIRRVGARFEDFFPLPSADGSRDPMDRSSVLNRIFHSRALRREQSQAMPPEDVVDLTQDRAEIIAPRRLPPLTYRRGQSYRGLAPRNDRLVEAYLHRSSSGLNHEQQPSSMDDRDSFSSIAAVIHGESHTVDTAVEIDSLVSLSTSSSRRRSDASRAPDVDSGDSRAPRRRRLN